MYRSILIDVSLVEDESISGAAATSSGEPMVKVACGNDWRKTLRLKIEIDKVVGSTAGIEIIYAEALVSI
jgi:hypothetical protein